MRELKFRAWTGGKMIDVPILDIGGVGENGYTVLTPKTHYANVPVMQYTGLLDKNGVKIYEGDVVCNKWGKPWKVGFEISKGSWRMVDIVEYSVLLSAAGVKNDGVEVIGNIYQSPDLLTKENK